MVNPFTLDAMETKKKLNEDKKLADKFVKQSDSLDTIIFYHILLLTNNRWMSAFRVSVY